MKKADFVIRSTLFEVWQISLTRNLGRYKIIIDILPIQGKQLYSSV